MLVGVIASLLVSGPFDLVHPVEPAAAVGATPDLDDQFPAVVLLRPHVGLCSGVLVADSLVLTAAHCLDDLVFGQQFGVYAGPVVAEQDFLQVDDFWLHPDFCPECERDRFDFALVELREPAPHSFELSSNLGTPEAFSELVDEGGPVTLVGYGTTEEQQPAANRQVLDQRVESLSPSLHEFSISGMGAPCKGDSGGPVFVRRDGALFLAGIASRVTNSACDGEATTRVGSTTAAMCWLSQMGVEGDVPSEEFCMPDPDRMGGCGRCSARERGGSAWLFVLLLAPALRRRRPPCARARITAAEPTAWARATGHPPRGTAAHWRPRRARRSRAR